MAPVWVRALHCDTCNMETAYWFVVNVADLVMHLEEDRDYYGNFYHQFITVVTFTQSAECYLIV